ncbi:MAG: L-glyceraldehyde 3-phosphate reductase [Rhodospirillales bacterium]|jgi:L-glyceraldehyde 3-phosphate reductase|nr:L-glyceraldehyde 3-phosphate reductase [Rhodospirillales bacterium]
MPYVPAADRYDAMTYNRCGSSGLKLPAISLGLWNSFGGADSLERGRAILRAAFDCGITHFDLANNYGPPAGSAEETLREILRKDFAGHRDELIISTKAGYPMWDGPYGQWESKKHLTASLDQSLRRLGLDYVDIFYSHRFDPETPLEETMAALDLAVRQGKALYVGISSYSAAKTREAAAILRRLGTPCLIHQPSYSMFNRWIEEDGLLDALEAEGMGCIAFSPLAQGMLTDKYLKGIPADSRAASGKPWLPKDYISEEALGRIRALNAIAERRGQSLAQMALAWALRDRRITTVLIGASRPEQILENAKVLDKPAFTAAELAEIDQYAVNLGINRWAASSSHK